MGELWINSVELSWKSIPHSHWPVSAAWVTCHPPPLSGENSLAPAVTPPSQENTLGQPFEVDVTVHCDLSKAGMTDDLSCTVNYAEIHR